LKNNETTAHAIGQRLVLNRLIQRRVSDSSLVTGSVSFSIEEIKHYLTGLRLVGEHKENDMLNCAISLLEDYEAGIEAVLERRKQNVTDEPEKTRK